MIAKSFYFVFVYVTLLQIPFGLADKNPNSREIEKELCERFIDMVERAKLYQLHEQKLTELLAFLDANGYEHPGKASVIQMIPSAIKSCFHMAESGMIKIDPFQMPKSGDIYKAQKMLDITIKPWDKISKSKKSN